MTISTAEGEKKQEYDILVITTGSRTNGDVPWKPSLSGYEATKDSLHKIQEQVKNAKTIVLGGAGPTGVETAGELGFEYGKTKEITLAGATNYGNVHRADESRLRLLLKSSSALPPA